LFFLKPTYPVVAGWWWWVIEETKFRKCLESITSTGTMLDAIGDWGLCGEGIVFGGGIGYLGTWSMTVKWLIGVVKKSSFSRLISEYSF
jgi:hypothetical protein